MADQYTPETDQIKYRYQLDVGNSPIAGRSFEEAGEEFDRWLRAHDAQVAADAIRGVAKLSRGADAHGVESVPTRWILDEADRIAGGTSA